MRLLISGGRDYKHTVQFIANLLSVISRENVEHIMAGRKVVDLTIIHGACPTGADQLADLIGKIIGAVIEPYPADWKRYDYAAGPIRNGEMLSKSHPDIVLVFPGGKGTADLLKKAKYHKMTVRPKMVIVEVHHEKD